MAGTEAWRVYECDKFVWRHTKGVQKCTVKGAQPQKLIYLGTPTTNLHEILYTYVTRHALSIGAINEAKNQYIATVAKGAAKYRFFVAMVNRSVAMDFKYHSILSGYRLHVMALLITQENPFKIPFEGQNKIGQKNGPQKIDTDTPGLISVASSDTSE